MDRYVDMYVDRKIDIYKFIDRCLAIQILGTNNAKFVHNSQRQSPSFTFNFF